MSTTQIVSHSIALACLSCLVACADDKQAETVDPDRSVTIMTFNVENLFDNVNDSGKNDETYLSIAAKQNDNHIAKCNTIEVERWRNDCLNLDWSDDIIEFKLSVLAETIKQVEGGADIIAFQEVENERILNRLADEYLAGLGYSAAILIEGQDLRGIDVAFLSKLPLVGEPELHALAFDDFPERGGDTRGVLEATFQLPDGSKLTGFAVHFPAPFHPTEMRIAAYQHLASLRNSLPDEHSVFAAGDFNTTSAENEQTGILERLARPHWVIAHEIALQPGCEHCRGTQYYARDDSWSFLDMILWSPARGENTTWQIRADSTRVMNRTERQVSADGTPERFNGIRRIGVSDHWPLLTSIEPTEKQ
ncbi:MAG: endonuclease/exonuclease/phosphatase family protein [Gammaproteobacteria bacterium]|nr:endonuclease/exonuclease/phosphatase family protein [Gammaproteobacteria bacterium]